MAKKFSKFLMFTALAGAAAAGAYYYLQNKNSSYSDDMDDDDDFDDFSDDLDDDTEGKDSTRNYVALNVQKVILAICRPISRPVFIRIQSAQYTVPLEFRQKHNVNQNVSEHCFPADVRHNLQKICAKGRAICQFIPAICTIRCISEINSLE